MAGDDTLDPRLRLMVQCGLMTEQQARDVDAFADGLCARIAAGELTVEEAGALAAKQGTEDAVRYKRGRKP